MGHIRDITTEFKTREVYAVYAECMYQPTWEKFEARAREFERAPNMRVWGYFEDGGLAGTLALLIDGSEGLIKGIAVSPRRRGGGIGKGLLLHGIREHSLSAVFAETDGDAVGFYKSCGFETREFMKNGYRRYACTLRVPAPGEP